MNISPVKLEPNKITMSVGIAVCGDYRIITLWKRFTEVALHVFYRMGSSIAYTGCSEVCFKADATGHQKAGCGGKWFSLA